MEKKQQQQQQPTFKLYKKKLITQEVEEIEQEIKQIMKNAPGIIRYYLKNWNKMSVYFNSKENDLYNYFLDKQFKEPKPGLQCKQKKQTQKKSVYITNNITNNNNTTQQINDKRSRHNRQLVSSSPSKSNEKSRKKQKREQVLSESEQKEYSKLEFFLSDLITQLKDHQLTYSNLCKMANIQFRNNLKEFQPYFATDLNYPVLLQKFKKQVLELIQQEIEDRLNLSKKFNNYSQQPQLWNATSKSTTVVADSNSTKSHGNYFPIQSPPNSSNNVLSNSFSQQSSCSHPKQSCSKETNDENDDNTFILSNEYPTQSKQYKNIPFQQTKSFALLSKVNFQKIQNNQSKSDNSRMKKNVDPKPKYQPPPDYKKQTQHILNEVALLKHEIKQDTSISAVPCKFTKELGQNSGKKDQKIPQKKICDNQEQKQQEDLKKNQKEIVQIKNELPMIIRSFIKGVDNLFQNNDN